MNTHISRFEKRLSDRRFPLRPPAGHVLCKEKTSFGHIVVSETSFRGHRARLLFVNDALQSAMAMEDGQQHMLLFPYLRGFNWGFRLKPDIRRTLLIGGGGFAYPRYYAHAFPELKLDIVEMSRDMIDISRRFFFLDELLQSSPSNLRLYEKDGISFLLGCPDRYDLLLCDAFTGKDADEGLFSADSLALFHAHLCETGICICNIITAVKGIHALPGHCLKKRFQAQFRNILLLQADESRRPEEKQNCLLIASDAALWTE